MADTAFTLINAEICAELALAPGLAEGRVYPQKLGPIAEEDPSAIVVRHGLARASALVVSGGPRDWVTLYLVECLARDAAADVPGTAAEEIFQAVFARLSARSAWGLGVAAVLLKPEVRWEFERADTDMACVTLAVQVQHRTLADLSAPT